MGLPEQEEHTIESSEVTTPEESHDLTEQGEEVQQVDGDTDAVEQTDSEATTPEESQALTEQGEEVQQVDGDTDAVEQTDSEPTSEVVETNDAETPNADSSDLDKIIATEENVEDESEGGLKDDGRGWYVVHCYSGYENKVRHNLEQRIETMGMKDEIYDIVVPTEEEIEVKEGKRRTIERRVFPGYILVYMVMSEESWYVVRNTPGVTGFVGMGNEPTPLRPEEVSQIIKRMEADAPRIKVSFKTGERVRIVDGPFNDFRGTVSEIDIDRAKVRVMVNFFGRETPIELDFLQVEKT
jgi:transcriptional antiterminator NusG